MGHRNCMLGSSIASWKHTPRVVSFQLADSTLACRLHVGYASSLPTPRGVCFQLADSATEFLSKPCIATGQLPLEYRFGRLKLQSG